MSGEGRAGRRGSSPGGVRFCGDGLTYTSIIGGSGGVARGLQELSFENAAGIFGFETCFTIKQV
jgi:hypothetical protein